MVTMTDAGCKLITELLLNKAAPGDLVLFLFANQVAPSRHTELADLQEVAGGGYVQRTLMPGGWSVKVDGKRILASHDKQVFSFTGIPVGADGQKSGNIWGYGVRSGQTLLWLELLHGTTKPKPFEVSVTGEDGDRITIVPNYFHQVVD